MIDGLSDEELVRAMCEILGEDEQTVRFIIAIERGEITGDVVEVDANGQPTGRNPNYDLDIFIEEAYARLRSQMG